MGYDAGSNIPSYRDLNLANLGEKHAKLAAARHERELEFIKNTLRSSNERNNQMQEQE